MGLYVGLAVGRCPRIRQRSVLFVRGWIGFRLVFRTVSRILKLDCLLGEQNSNSRYMLPRKRGDGFHDRPVMLGLCFRKLNL